MKRIEKKNIKKVQLNLHEIIFLHHYLLNIAGIALYHFLGSVVVRRTSGDSDGAGSNPSAIISTGFVQTGTSWFYYP